MDEDWLGQQREAMAAIAPIFDELEAKINSHGPVDMVQAYIIMMGALRELDMDKTSLEQFVAVLMADRTYTAPTAL
jgi:hypothetical protein